MAESEAAYAKETAAYAKVIARAWRDSAFKRQLLADPAAALAAMGARVPAGVALKMAENTNQVTNLILPAPPAGTGLSDEALEKAAVEALKGLGGFHGNIVDPGPQPVR